MRAPPFVLVSDHRWAIATEDDWNELAVFQFLRYGEFRVSATGGLPERFKRGFAKATLGQLPALDYEQPQAGNLTPMWSTSSTCSNTGASSIQMKSLLILSILVKLTQSGR